MNIAQKLKKRRIELQLSQEEAADKAGISRRTLAYYESGERVPNAENLLSLCNLYGLSINEFVEQNLPKEVEEINKTNNPDVVAKIDKYLEYEQNKKDSFRKTFFYFCLIISVVSVLTCILLCVIKLVLINAYGYSFGEATAAMWTSLFQALIVFVNDPKVQGFPLVSITIISLIAIGWITYFIVKLIKKHSK